jgi:hypothetical protein
VPSKKSRFSPKKPLSTSQNVFIRPNSPNGGFKMFLFAQTAQTEGSKRFYSPKQPERRVQNVFIRPNQPERRVQNVFIMPPRPAVGNKTVFSRVFLIYYLHFNLSKPTK